MEREMLCFLYDFSCLRPVNKDSKASGAKTKEGVSTFFFAEHQSQSSALSSGRDLTATTLSGVMNVVLQYMVMVPGVPEIKPERRRNERSDVETDVGEVAYYTDVYKQRTILMYIIR